MVQAVESLAKTNGSTKQAPKAGRFGRRGPGGNAKEGKGMGKAPATSARTGLRQSTPEGTVEPKPGADAKQAKERAQVLERTLQQIERSFGKGSIMTLNEDAFAAIPGISTGTLSLDLALGGKGLPVGRVVEIYGPESSGKTTLALTVLGHAQKDGGVCAFIDAEHALDPSWATKLGVNIDDLLVSQPNSGEEALEICELLVRSNAVSLVVIDSVAALVPRVELEGEMGDTHVGLQARLMSQALRKLTGAIAKTQCTVIFINQIREKIGVMFGSPETTTGGRALKFYSSVRIDVRRISAIKDGDQNVGNRVRARVVKNKMAPPFRDAEFDIMFNEGISTTGDLIDLGVAENIVEKSGSWFNFGDVRLGQGRENAKRHLADNPEIAKEIRVGVLKAKGLLKSPEPDGKAESDSGDTAGDSSKPDQPVPKG